MTREHCDNCDAVMAGPAPTLPSFAVTLSGGDVVELSSTIRNPVTLRNVLLCETCLLALQRKALAEGRLLRDIKPRFEMSH